MEIVQVGLENQPPKAPRASDGLSDHLLVYLLRWMIVVRQHLLWALFRGWPNSNGQQSWKCDMLKPPPFLALEVLWHLINWPLVFSSVKSPQSMLTCKYRSMMATHMYSVSCSSLNLECTCTSQSTRMARMRPFISLPSRKCGLMDCSTWWWNWEVYKADFGEQGPAVKHREL